MRRGKRGFSNKLLGVVLAGHYTRIAVMDSFAILKGTKDGKVVDITGGEVVRTLRDRVFKSG